MNFNETYQAMQAASDRMIASAVRLFLKRKISGYKFKVHGGMVTAVLFVFRD